MGQGRVVVALLAASLAALLSARAAEGPLDVSGQAPPSIPGSPETWAHVGNADGGPYEKRYGPPTNISACAMADGVTLPRAQSVRIRGRFEPGTILGRRPEAARGSTVRSACDTGGQVATPGAADAGVPCTKVIFAICCEDRRRQCVQVNPVPELLGPLEFDANLYRNERVVVVGATDGSEADFHFWDFQVMADFAKRTREGRDSGLRSIVAAAGQAAERPVRVRGCFRGRNLFGDLPPASRRGSSDWVIADQGVALWVTGKAPKGEGWALDLETLSESSRWVEVEGKIVARDGVIYLKATRVALVSGPLAAAGAEQP